jgi:8-oxo-dGTP pyrophosphatase MutT (NUDIX family)
MARVIEQSGVVPFRVRRGTVEVLLITSSDGKRWGIPKGLIEPGMTPAESAANEAFEEAGVLGRVLEQAIGSFAYRKWGGRCEVKVFPMRVKDELNEWPESRERRRKWLPLKKAAKRATLAGVREVIWKLHELVAADAA